MEGLGVEENIGDRTNLIVNYLPQHLTDDEFRKMFSVYGKLKSCKICRNKATNYSYGFGFADFFNPEDAARAQRELNGMPVAHKRIKVAFSRPSEESTKGANIYVRNLPKHYGDEEVYQLFSPFGEIVHVKILRDNVTNESKTVGFVLFDKKDMADKAINGLNGYTPPGALECLLVKRPDEEKRKLNATNASLHYAQTVGLRNTRPEPLTCKSPFTIFVYNIGTSCTEAEVYRLFAPFGALQKVDLVRDMESDLCKGYAFVTFYDKGAAEMAIMSLNGFFYNGKPLQVRFKK